MARKQLRIALDENDEIVRAWLRWLHSAYPGASASGALLEAMQLQLGVEVDDAARLGIRRTAWRTASTAARRHLARALRAAADAFESAPLIPIDE